MSIGFTLPSAHSSSIRAQRNMGLINLSECHTFGRKKRTRKGSNCVFPSPKRWHYGMCEGSVHFLRILFMLQHLTQHTLLQMGRRRLHLQYLTAASKKKPNACCCLLRSEIWWNFRLLNQTRVHLSLLPQLPKLTNKRLQVFFNVVSHRRNGFGELKVLSSSCWAVTAGYHID